MSSLVKIMAHSHPSSCNFDPADTLSALHCVPLLRKPESSVLDAFTVCTCRRMRMTESFDEDNLKTGSKASAKRSVLVMRAIQAATVAAVALLYYQLMPGGLLAETGLGQAAQSLARAVARSIATVCFPQTCRYPPLGDECLQMEWKLLVTSSLCGAVFKSAILDLRDLMLCRAC